MDSSSINSCRDSTAKSAKKACASVLKRVTPSPSRTLRNSERRNAFWEWWARLMLSRSTACSWECNLLVILMPILDHWPRTSQPWPNATSPSLPGPSSVRWLPSASRSTTSNLSMSWFTGADVPTSLCRRHYNWLCLLAWSQLLLCWLGLWFASRLCLSWFLWYGVLASSAHC